MTGVWCFVCARALGGDGLRWVGVLAALFFFFFVPALLCSLSVDLPSGFFGQVCDLVFHVLSGFGLL